jgi:hypothetical protein
VKTGIEKIVFLEKMYYICYLKQNIMQIAYTSPIGLEVSKGDWDDSEWTVTGNARKELTIKEFDSAYEFEEFIQEKINCKGITFDSESCQFFAYAKTKARAVKFAKDIDKYFEKVRTTMAKLL